MELKQNNLLLKLMNILEFQLPYHLFTYEMRVSTRKKPKSAINNPPVFNRIFLRADKVHCNYNICKSQPIEAISQQGYFDRFPQALHTHFLAKPLQNPVSTPDVSATIPVLFIPGML